MNIHCKVRKESSKKGSSQENVTFERQLLILNEVDEKCCRSEEYQNAKTPHGRAIILNKFLKENYKEFQIKQPSRKFGQWQNSVGKIESGDICIDKRRSKFHGEIVESQVAQILKQSDVKATLNTIRELFKKSCEQVFANDKARLDRLSEHEIVKSFARDFCLRHGIRFSNESSGLVYFDFLVDNVLLSISDLILWTGDVLSCRQLKEVVLFESFLKIG
jgi:hypothetical protein